MFPSDFSLKNTDCLVIYSRLITYGSSGLRRQTAGGPAATSVPAAMSLSGLSEIFSLNVKLFHKIICQTQSKSNCFLSHKN